MHPGIWRMIKTSLQHDFISDNHPFFVDQVPSMVTVSTIKFVNNLIALQTRLERESPQHHYMDLAKCYTHEMIVFLQSYCFGAMFGVGATWPIPSPLDEDKEEVFNSRPPVLLRIARIGELRMICLAVSFVQCS
jgi:hypothetical protein